MFTNKTETNKYLNRTKVTIHSKDSLLELLINRTKKLLSEINGAILYKKGLLNDANAVQVNLLIESRILECDTILNDDNINEKHRYLNIIQKWFSGEIEFIDKLVKALPPPQIKIPTNTASTIVETKPIFKPEMIDQIFALLKDFFNPEHQIHLKEILLSGGNSKVKLLFLDNGNRLADAFKQLINSDIITGCQKKILENWICVNFQYVNQQKTKDFKPQYINDIISTNKDKCQNPILNVSKDKTTGLYYISKA